MTVQNLPKVTVYIVTILGLFGAVLLGHYAGQGNTKDIFLLLAAFGGISFFLTLGKNYWMFLVFALSSGLPALPFGGRTLQLGELGAATCFIVFLTMLAFHKNHINLLNIQTVVVVLFTIWVAFIYMQNPVGFAMFGSQDVGIREYMKILFGLLSFLVISNQIIGEKDCRWLILIMVGGPFLALAWTIFDYKVLGAGGWADDEGEYTWHQGLSRPAYMVVLYLFCRYGARRIFSFGYPGLLVLTIASFVIALLSGKRAVVASALMTPFFAAFLRRQKAHAIIYAVVGTLLLGTLVIGHGNAFHLPFAVQRSLANLPGDWDYAVKDITKEGGDQFRTIMRELAWAKIKLHPIVGQGIGFSMSDVANINPENYMQNIEVALALGSSWHNTWLGLWADFGLPAMILHAVICILCLATAWMAFRGSITNTPFPSAFNVVAMMMLLELIFASLRSYTSGSSTIPYFLWWQFGLVVALVRSLEHFRMLGQKPDGTKIEDGAPEKRPTTNSVVTAQS